MDFNINASNVFVVYISTYLLFYIYSLISLLVTPNMIYGKIKPTVLIIWLHENFKLKYLWINFYWFSIVFWPPLPKVKLLVFSGVHLCSLMFCFYSLGFIGIHQCSTYVHLCPNLRVTLVGIVMQYVSRNSFILFILLKLASCLFCRHIKKLKNNTL